MSRREVRSAQDPEIERDMLDILKKAFVIIDNCVDFNICNGSHATNVLKTLEIFGEVFKTSSVTNLSSNTTSDLVKLFGLIHKAEDLGREGRPASCPAWVLGLHLDDTLKGSLCMALNQPKER